VGTVTFDHVNPRAIQFNTHTDFPFSRASFVDFLTLRKLNNKEDVPAEETVRIKLFVCKNYYFI